jgi:hypothetical protein
MAPGELAFVIGFQCVLRGRELRADGIIDQIQDEARAGLAVPMRVQLLQRADATGVNPPATLFVDIFFQIAG